MNSEEISSRSRLAVVGVAKNCGKTTTLNYLLRKRVGPPPALISIGVDGESEDILLGTSKPPIEVQPGQWVVTAQQAAERSTARLEYIQPLGIETPLGEVLACRVVDRGTVMLAGLRHRREVLRALEILEESGCEDIWIDGAYGRVAGAHPSVTDAVVISTGAIAAAGVDGVVERTRDLISRLVLPPVEDKAQRSVLEYAIAEDRAFLLDEEKGAVALPARSALIGLSRARKSWTPTIKAVAVPGLVSDRVAEELLAARSEGVLLIPDGTVLHLDRRLWRRLRQEWTVRALHPIEVAGISYNPTSITSSAVKDEVLAGALREAWPGLSVFNPERGRPRPQ